MKPDHDIPSGALESWGIAPLLFQKRETGAELLFHNSITGNFMVYQKRLETNL